MRFAPETQGHPPAETCSSGRTRASPAEGEVPGRKPRNRDPRWAFRGLPRGGTLGVERPPGELTGSSVGTARIWTCGSQSRPPEPPVHPGGDGEPPAPASPQPTLPLRGQQSAACASALLGGQTDVQTSNKYRTTVGYNKKVVALRRRLTYV